MSYNLTLVQQSITAQDTLSLNHLSKGWKMEQSRIFLRIHYLLALGRETARTRRTLIRMMTPGQMECLQILVKQILDGQIPILNRDARYFDRYRRLLRIVKSGWVSLTRKKRLLSIRHALLPRLLRRRYLQYAILNEIRSSEN